MPELPDVEGLRRLIERVLVGARILGVKGPDASVVRNATLAQLGRAVRGRCIASATRHGKWLELVTDGASIVVHLGMTGRFRYLADRVPSERFQRLSLQTDRGELRFVDQRRLGGVWLAVSEADARTIKGDLGPDALGLSCADLAKIVGGTSRMLKVVLMDQSRVAGLGNMLSDEVLWRARLHPTQAASGLTSPDLNRLRVALDVTLKGSVRAGRIPRSATWLSSQRDRDDPTCPRCSTQLRWSKLNGRSALWCPNCQPAPASKPSEPAMTSRVPVTHGSRR